MNKDKISTLVASVAFIGLGFYSIWLWIRGWGGREQELLNPKNANVINKLYLLLTGCGGIVIGLIMLINILGELRRGN